MQTDFTPELLATDAGSRANEILRTCVHCGFCNATCPTYLLTGDELDGPRGRIYLIKELFEGSADARRATQHLDRCLTCRACETTCPSGVAYGELAEIARHKIGVKRSGVHGLKRRLLQWMVPNPNRLRAMARLGRLFRWLLPRALAKQVPERLGQPVGSLPEGDRQILLLNGCAQQVATAETNIKLVNLLKTRGIGVLVAEAEVCCGSLDLHLGDESAALTVMRKNIGALKPYLAQVDAIISSASGCGVTLKDYGRLMQHDAHYADDAAQVSARVVDVAQYLAQDLELQAATDYRRVAWQAPCTLQHGQQISGVVEGLLTGAGYELVPVADSHLCCGSAGTYSMLQPQMANQLRQNKLDNLLRHGPDVIATANVGCQTHLAGDQVPVMHWIELVK
jgi:glycolate oxidase iron-sulfur subunit